MWALRVKNKVTGKVVSYNYKDKKDAIKWLAYFYERIDIKDVIAYLEEVEEDD